MSGAHVNDTGANTVSFARKLAESPRFKTLFRDGMNLVEEVAAYLDGPGRDAAKALPRTVAIAYAAESMRLTTRLMQLASWLLVRRAINEGEMQASEDAGENRKARLCAQDIASNPGLFEQLPVELQELTSRSLRLQARLLYLDRSIHETEDDETSESRAVVPPSLAQSNMLSELGSQWEKLRVAFNGRQ